MKALRKRCEKLTICQNDAGDNGKLVSLIFSETLEEQQDLEIKQKSNSHAYAQDYPFSPAIFVIPYRGSCVHMKSYNTGFQFFLAVCSVYIQDPHHNLRGPVWGWVGVCKFPIWISNLFKFCTSLFCGISTWVLPFTAILLISMLLFQR